MKFWMPPIPNHTKGGEEIGGGKRKYEEVVEEGGGPKVLLRFKGSKGTALTLVVLIALPKNGQKWF